MTRSIRLRRLNSGVTSPPPEPIDASELTKVFAAPRWLRDVGITSWLLVGFLIVVVGLIYLLSLTETILLPLITAGIVAAVSSPIVGWLGGKRVSRGIGAALVMLLIVALGVLTFLLIFGGITSELGSISDHLKNAAATMEGWLKSLGIDPQSAADANSTASSSSTDTVNTLLHGVASGIAGITSLAFFLALTALSLFFLLKDGPQIRAWSERQVGLPPGVAHTINGRVLQSLRGYFVGVTAVAVFNAVLVGLGAWILGVPLVATIALVTFLGAYIPYLGAWGAGVFSVLLALGGAGEEAAIGMAVIQLLANGILQQMIQPIAYGAALGIHPLAVLVVTIAGGCLFGAVGLILAAPLTSAVVRITADLSRATAGAAAAPPAQPGTAPA